MRDCPNRDGKKTANSVPKEYSQTKRCFYALWTRGKKPDNSYDDVSMSFFYFSDTSSL